jgi:hypothetical protein
MEESTIKSFINDPGKLISKITSTRKTDDDDYKQYEPANHKVTEASHRKDREVMKPVYDSNGQEELIPEGMPGAGEPRMRSTTEKVARITSSAQKMIVQWACQIAAGVPVEVTPPNDMKPDTAEEKLYKMLLRTLKDNKIEYLDKEILRLKKTYKICAEVWFSEECLTTYWKDLGNTGSKFKMRLMIMSPETGDTLYPIKNGIGKMIALGREYKALEGDDNKEVSKFDLFTKDAIYTYTQANGGWLLDAEATKKLSYGKCNFIVHEQAAVEWADVQGKIERLETVYSNHADQNDATAFPILVAKGKLTGYAARGETGKTFETSEDGDLKFLEATGAPESVKMERDNLIKLIYDETFTPQISFSDATSLGANVPGVTMKLFFLPATLKAMNEQSGGWGMCVQRRFNFLLTAMKVINTSLATVEIEVTPRFSIFMPSNDVEKYQNIISLVAAGLLSKSKAIEMLALTDDHAEEFERIQKELSDAQAKAIELAQKTKPVEQPTT